MTSTDEAIDAMVDTHDLTDLWKEWEPVLFANVKDEVAQDKLNECVHELLRKAASEGAGTCKAKLYKPEYGTSDCTVCECGEINDISAIYCNRCGKRIEVGER